MTLFERITVSLSVVYKRIRLHSFKNRLHELQRGTPCNSARAGSFPRLYLQLSLEERGPSLGICLWVTV